MMAPVSTPNMLASMTFIIYYSCAQVQAFLHILTALLDKYMLRDGNSSELAAAASADSAPPVLPSGKLSIMAMSTKLTLVLQIIKLVMYFITFDQHWPQLL